ncbi:response regulator transcription factor [Pyxidicoccus sp. MSG2]|uniref:response regulator transcription factor n=1 Tax=Pyxidicoccus sp. MSG2 TaxID=2996790 RepID=UPI00226F6092|nr:response regulator transcription factor [Pyxidicoccus sp. MSG2]MCY1022927.1 response regulator transcription factor [Pyxidicoccus sp. MSG2]
MEKQSQTSTSTPSVFIVDDDRALTAMIADYLRMHGFSAESEVSGERAVPRILATRPDLVVLDVMLPGKDGFAVCRELRGAYPGPILMLTGRGAEVDEVVGLESGADDYLPKPVRPRVLLARLRALLRRTSAPPQSDGTPVRVGELTVDSTRRTAWLRGKELDLTSGEFDVLLLLVAHAGQVVSRQLMYQRLRGVEQDDIDRSVDLRVSRLRHKLREASGEADAIKTVRGVGYLYTVS